MFLDQPKINGDDYRIPYLYPKNMFRFVNINIFCAEFDSNCDFVVSFEFIFCPFNKDVGFSNTYKM